MYFFFFLNNKINNAGAPQGSLLINEVTANNKKEKLKTFYIIVQSQ